MGEYTFIQAEVMKFFSRTFSSNCVDVPPEAQAFLELLDTNFFITRLVSIVLCAKKARFPAQKRRHIEPNSPEKNGPCLDLLQPH